MSDSDDLAQYSERADFLELGELADWTVDHEYFRFIQKKVTQPGAKLLVGPRGSGKTHHFRYAHQQCLEKNTAPLTIYVSFTRYYHLEPYLREASEAVQIFHSWVLAKILQSMSVDYSDQYSEVINELASLKKENLDKFIAAAERGIDPSAVDKEGAQYTISLVVETAERIMKILSRKRIVLMLDDAALVLTPEYMVEFFDIFRSLKTSKISPKASVYPGTTEYGPRFHADHDAEKVAAWLDVNDSGYIGFMERIARDRLNLDESELPKDLLKAIAYASFGVPRAFITMVRSYLESDASSKQQKFNLMIRSHVEFRKTEYLSLAEKTPQYHDIIDVGWKLFDRIIETATKTTLDLKGGEKHVQIGILRDFDSKCERMIRFLIEAGLLFQLPSVSHGADREYLRFTPHYAFLIDRRAFSPGKGWSPQKMVERIEVPEKKHPIRRQLNSLLDGSDVSRIELNLPSCKSCGADRISAHQSYCHQCGTKLIESSIFEACMRIKVEDLPITENQKRRIINETEIRTLGDIVTSPDPASELRKAKSIGKVRAQRIYILAKSIEEEFFS